MASGLPASLAPLRRSVCGDHTAETAAVAEAPGLARACAAFGGDYRVVAHSLGCRLVLEALPLLPAEQRPREVRLRRSQSFSSSTHTVMLQRWLQTISNQAEQNNWHCRCRQRR